VLQQSEA